MKILGKSALESYVIFTLCVMFSFYCFVDWNCYYDQKKNLMNFKLIVVHNEVEVKEPHIYLYRSDQMKMRDTIAFEHMKQNDGSC